MYAEADLIPLSALQHWAFCPRQCGLIHLEGLWAENLLTALGRVMHDKAHQGGPERQGRIRVERGLALRSRSLGLSGQADVVEFHPQQDSWRPYPVEYKRGRPKSHNADRLQLCAQALCLEEMLGVPVPDGALFYGAKRRRQEVRFDSELRRAVDRAAGQVHAMLASGRTPPPDQGPHCRNCSLREICLPDRTGSPAAAGRYLSRQIRAAWEEP